MQEIQPASDAHAARWLLKADVPWQNLVTFGPPGFAAYVRIALSQTDVGPTSDDRPVDNVRAALAVLASYTSTADRGYAAVWEGWGGGPPSPLAPRVAIPNREMLLFAGRVESLRDAPARAWHDFVESVHQQPPHLVWPDDHAWCLACEVDEEIEFTVGCSNDAAEALSRALPSAVRRVDYGEAVPTCGDGQ